MTTAHAIKELFSDLIEQHVHAGHRRDEDAWVLGALVKWRLHDWHLDVPDVQVEPLAKDWLRVRIPYSWLKTTQYFAALGVKPREDEVTGGTGLAEFEVEVARGIHMYIIDSSVELFGGDGQTNKFMHNYVYSKDRSTIQAYTFA